MKKNEKKEVNELIKKGFTKLFRVYCHILSCHYNQLTNKQLQEMIMLMFRHLYVFSRKQNLLKKKEYEPLGKLPSKIDFEFGLDKMK